MKRPLPILFILVLFLTPSGLASKISLTTTVSAEIMLKENSTVSIELLNSGDEPAFNLKLSFTSECFNSEPIYIQKLDPGKSFKGMINVSLKKEIGEGNHPLVLFTDYTDMNGYPFSSVSPLMIVYKTPTISRVSGILSDVNLNKDTKKLKLILRNLDEVEHEVKVRLFLPRELDCDKTEMNISLEPKSERTLEFRVSNLGALEGSSYVVLASIEYEEANKHYSSFANGMVKITEKKHANFPEWLPFLSIALLFMIFIYYSSRKLFKMRIRLGGSREYEVQAIEKFV